MYIGKSGANVRILNRKTADRTLLKDFCGRVTDLAFAFTDKILLAAIDEMGNLYIHQITGASEGKIQYPFETFTCLVVIIALT